MPATIKISTKTTDMTMIVSVSPSDAEHELVALAMYDAVAFDVFFEAVADAVKRATAVAWMFAYSLIKISAKSDGVI